MITTATYLSDASQYDSSCRRILVDANRRSYSLHDPIYQCDCSCRHSDAPWISRASPPLSINGRIFEKGVGIATPFVLTYELAGRFTEFVGIVGVDDVEPHPEDWRFDVYLDDVKAGSWVIAQQGQVEVRVGVADIEELVLVGAGRNELAVILADARLIVAPHQSSTSGRSAGTRRSMFELDDRLVLESEALLLASAAKRISATHGPDDRPKALGGFGRTTSTRGADVWAGLNEPGDRLLWQTMIRRAGNYRLWTRVVSSPRSGCT